MSETQKETINTESGTIFRILQWRATDLQTQPIYRLEPKGVLSSQDAIQLSARRLERRGTTTNLPPENLELNPLFLLFAIANGVRNFDFAEIAYPVIDRRTNTLQVAEFEMTLKDAADILNMCLEKAGLQQDSLKNAFVSYLISAFSLSHVCRHYNNDALSPLINVFENHFVHLQQTAIEALVSEKLTTIAERLADFQKIIAGFNSNFQIVCGTTSSGIPVEIVDLVGHKIVDTKQYP
jgi:hypothetical protein